jgi:CheY-like chemotaxis protein
MVNSAGTGLNVRMPNFLLGCAILLLLLLVASMTMLWRQRCFRQLYESNPLPLFRLDADLRLILCNRAFAQLMGYSSSRECRALFAEYPHGLAIPAADAQEVLVRAVPFDGTLRSKFLLETRYGEAIGQGVELFQRPSSGVADLCLQAGSSEQAAASEFDGFLAQPLLPAFVLRPNLQVRAANSLAARDFGAGVVLGRLESLFPRADRARVISLIERRLGSNSSASLRFPALLQNAEIRDCDWFFLRSPASSGELLVLCLVEPAVLPMQAVVDQVLARSWGHWTLDLVQQTLALSEHWWRFLGYAAPPPPQALGLWQELIAPQDQERVVQALTDYLQGRCQQFAVNHRMAGADGIEHQVRTTAVAVTRAENGTVLRVVGLNVLVPRPANGNPSPAGVGIVGDASVGQVLGDDVVHDLLNHNAVILGHGALLGQNIEPGNGFQASIDAIQAAAAGIRGLLVKPDRSTFGALLARLNQQLGTTINWSEAASHAPGSDLLVDGARVRGVLQPLLQFCLSIRAACPGQLELLNLPPVATDCCSVCGASLAANEKQGPVPWQLSLVIPAIELDRAILGYLFAPEFGLRSLAGDNPLSALSQQIHVDGGHVLVESTAAGLRLTLSWPAGCNPFAVAAPLPLQVAEQTIGQSGAQVHITVVDDQPAVSTYLQTILRQAGYVVSVFNDPRLALDVLRAEPLMTDLLITDQNMPALTGNAIIQAMRQVRPALPIIVCTGYSAQDPVLMTPGGAISVLQKPFEPARLLASISQVLGQPLPA